MQYIAKQNEYWIAWNDEKIHKGEVKEGHQVATNMPNFETYTDEKEWKDVLEKLGYEWEDELEVQQ